MYLQDFPYNADTQYSASTDTSKLTITLKVTRFKLALFITRFIQIMVGILEPSISTQHEEKTNDSIMDLNFKIYRLIKDGRLWLGRLIGKIK